MGGVSARREALGCLVDSGESPGRNRVLRRVYARHEAPNRQRAGGLAGPLRLERQGYQSAGSGECYG